MRTGRTNGSRTYSYIYNGGSLSRMTVDGHTLDFYYDASGRPLSLTYDGTSYYYALNLQGDVTAILNGSGNAVVTYTYDSWGDLQETSGSLKDTLGFYNPLRYRGYVYDAETGMYYLQSRYYIPNLCRFLNADAFIATGQGILGNNMFAYCHNNPLLYKDPEGNTSIYTSDMVYPIKLEDVGNRMSYIVPINGYEGSVGKQTDAILVDMLVAKSIDAFMHAYNQLTELQIMQFAKHLYGDYQMARGIVLICQGVATVFLPDVSICDEVLGAGKIIKGIILIAKGSQNTETAKGVE